MLFIYFKEIELLEIRNQGQGHKNKYVQMPPSIHHQRNPDTQKIIFTKLKSRTPNRKLINVAAKAEMKQFVFYFSIHSNAALKSMWFLFDI